VDRVALREGGELAEDVGGINTMQFFGHPELRVFVGGGFGHL
jgi:hypothetical protein